MSNTDVSWCWYFVVFRLCNQHPTLSQHYIDVKYWRQPDFHLQPKCNVCPTSCPTSTWRYIQVDVRYLLGLFYSLWIHCLVWVTAKSTYILGNNGSHLIRFVSKNCSKYTYKSKCLWIFFMSFVTQRCCCDHIDFSFSISIFCKLFVCVCVCVCLFGCFPDLGRLPVAPDGCTPAYIFLCT